MSTKARNQPGGSPCILPLQLAAAEVPENVKKRIWRTLFGDMPPRKSGGGGRGYQGQSDFEIFKDLTKVI